MNTNGNKMSKISEVLTIVFVILKLCGVINWAWWWVLSPLWIGLSLIFISVVIVILIRKKNDDYKA